MQLTRVLNAFKKNQIEIKHEEGTKRYFASKNGKKLLFYTQTELVEEVFHFTYQSPNTDVMTDYFEDTYYNTIKAALQFFERNG